MASPYVDGWGGSGRAAAKPYLQVTWLFWSLPLATKEHQNSGWQSVGYLCVLYPMSWPQRWSISLLGPFPWRTLHLLRFCWQWAATMSLFTVPPLEPMRWPVCWLLQSLCHFALSSSTLYYLVITVWMMCSTCLHLQHRWLHRIILMWLLHLHAVTVAVII